MSIYLSDRQHHRCDLGGLLSGWVGGWDVVRVSGCFGGWVFGWMGEEDERGWVRGWDGMGERVGERVCDRVCEVGWGG